MVVIIHGGSVSHFAIDVKARLYFWIKLSANIKTKHIFLFTGDCYEELLTVLMNIEYFLQLIIEYIDQLEVRGCISYP